MRLLVQAEGFYGQAQGDTSGARLYAYGWYGRPGTSSFRAGSTSRRAMPTSTTTAASRAEASSVVSAATSYYFRRNSLKIVLDYSRTHRQRPTGSPANDSAFMVQAQLMP